MTKEKELLLKQAVDKVYSIGFGLEPDDLLENYFAEKLMIIGTAVDEKFSTLSGMRTLIQRQKEQSQGMDISFERNEIYRDVAADEKIAIIVEDVVATIKINGDTMHFDVRSSGIMEYRNEQWKLIHWHASKPEQVQSETDTFGVEEWKQKTEELEKLVSERTAELQKSLEELKATQSQLIHSEKMASLGELTAGIAHEIQNPLNFVNNFSEINKELVDELQQELKAGKINEAIEISNDIKANEEKINHHGKRADAIVKGMLQHSSSGSGKKEPTDINKLTDEYLRLAYHGLRAKDNSFNATLKTEFDPTITNVNIIPQDIGRVILNLITNAFYVVGEKKKLLANSQKLIATPYEPTVSVSTKKLAGKIEIKVTDNGNGIPQTITDKIFQPFFTTKPTGQGTGLGLSLSYDIVKAHGGDLKVETKEGEGSNFVISLPVN